MITVHIDRSRAPWTILTCIFLLGGVACNDAKAPAPGATVDAASNADENALRNRTLAAIEKYELTVIPRDCLTVEIDGTIPDGYELTVYELHDERCGGDPATQPRLFGMQMPRSGARILSDAKSTDGEFQLLQ